jgi:hypothetical protein
MPRNPSRGVKRLPPAEDPFASHEALDRAHLAAVFFDEHVAQHPYVRAVPKLRRRADRLATQLADFYQAVGAERFRD